MPYKFETEKLKIPIKLDRRVKLTINDKLKIIDIYSKGHTSIHSLSRMFHVSRRTIHFILFPERLEKAKKNQQMRYRLKKKKYGKIYEKRNANYAKQHRKYKQQLYKLGKLSKQKIK